MEGHYSINELNQVVQETETKLAELAKTVDVMMETMKWQNKIFKLLTGQIEELAADQFKQNTENKIQNMQRQLNRIQGIHGA